MDPIIEVPPEDSPVDPAARPGASRDRWLRAFLIAAGLGASVFLLVDAATRRFKVDGPSMGPTLRRGSYVLVDKVVYRFARPSRGDVVVFCQPDDRKSDYIKRLIGVPGDTLEVAQGEVYLNGQPLIEPYCHGATNGRVPVFRLGQDDYFVMGDNRSLSRDSRNFGAIHRTDILGRARFVYWPPGSWGPIRPGRPNG